MNIVKELIFIAKQLNPPMSPQQAVKVHNLESQGNEIATWDHDKVYLQGIKNPNKKFTVYSYGVVQDGWRGTL